MLGSSESSQESKPTKITTIGDFRLLKKLGEGGMGSVYKAHQISMERDVALKVLSKQLANNKDFVLRFQREARLMAQLDHPNILRSYAVGEERGYHYFAMEYVDGGSLESWLKKAGKLSVGDALHILLTCARAMDHAHEKGLVHRDLKPDNIMLTSKGVIKVADLGLAKALTEDLQLTKTGTGAGTPLYMSPEQSRDVKHVDRRSDIYSLGIILYRLLTGDLPFKGETFVEVFKSKEDGKYPPARRSNLEVPDRLDLIIDKMLAKKLESRYQTCAEVVKDLEGLGLARATLSFLEEPAAEQPAAAEAQAKRAAKPGAAGKPGARPAGPGKKTAAAAPAEVAEPDIWYLTYESRQGKLETRRLTTAQVRELVRDPHFDLNAQASRTQHGEFRSLATYREFEPALTGRLVKAKADRRTAQFHAIYEKLDKEEISRKRWRWFRDVTHNVVGYGLLLLWIAVIGGIGVGLYLLAVYIVWPYVKAKFGLG